MSIATLNGGQGLTDVIKWPDGAWENTLFSFTSVSASTHQRALHFIAPKTGTLSKFHFRTNFVTTGDDLKISFQDAKADGTPDGIVDEFRVLTVNSADDNKWLTTGIISNDGTDLGTKRTVTKGDSLCVVLEWNAYVAGSLTYCILPAPKVDAGVKYFSSTNSGSTWLTVFGSPCCAIEYDDGTFAYLENVSPFETLFSTSINTGSTPDEYCLRFKLPFPVQVRGVAIKAATQDTLFSLYPDSGAALATSTPIFQSTDSTLRHEAYFDPAVDLNKDTFYRIGWKPTTLTSRFLQIQTFQNAAMRETFDIGPIFSLGSRTDGGAWTDDTTRMMMATLLVTGLEVGGGGSATCNYGAIPNGIRVKPAIM